MEYKIKSQEKFSFAGYEVIVGLNFLPLSFKQSIDADATLSKQWQKKINDGVIEEVIE